MGNAENLGMDAEFGVVKHHIQTRIPSTITMDTFHSHTPTKPMQVMLIEGMCKDTEPYIYTWLSAMLTKEQYA